MAVREIVKNVFSVGSIDWDRRLFDELIPLPDGTTYNSYLIKGSSKIALIDSVDPTKQKELIENLKRAKVDRIDYIVQHHGEQDHSGAIPRLLEKYPMAKVVCNKKCKEFLMELLLIPQDKFIEVGENEEISLGGKTLRFIFTPWVHWPETFVTFLKEDGILFTCDFFGSHYSTSDMYAKEEKVYTAAKRYYAEIMMPFRKTIQANIEKVEKLNAKMIAPSHGPIHGNPKFIIDAYKDWASDIPKDEVIVAFVSMHGSIEKCARYLADRLVEKGVNVKLYNLTRTDIGELAMDLVDACTLVLLTPTVLAGAHPSAIYSATLVSALRPKLKYAALVVSYLWGGKAPDQIKGILSSLPIELIDGIMVRGHPKEGDYRALDELADKIILKHKELFNK